MRPNISKDLFQATCDSICREGTKAENTKNINDYLWE